MEQKFIYFLWLLIGVTILAGSILQAQQIKRGGNRHFEALLNHSNLQKLQDVRHHTAIGIIVKGVIWTFLFEFTLCLFYLPSFKDQPSNNKLVLLFASLTVLIILVPVKTLVVKSATRKVAAK